MAFGATVEAALRMSFDLSTLNPGAPRKSLPFHRAILDEIWARNPDGARRAMLRLMDLTERNITSALCPAGKMARRWQPPTPAVRPTAYA